MFRAGSGSGVWPRSPLLKTLGLPRIMIMRSWRLGCTGTFRYSSGPVPLLQGFVNFAQTAFSEVGLMGALGSHCAKPDLAIWAHQAGQISGQAPVSYRRG